MISRRRRPKLLAAALIAMILSCGPEKPSAPAPLSPDERYLVNAYLRVRRAGALYPYQRSVADSLLSRLAGEVDTLRVARTVASLNATPERWMIVFETIERALAEPADTTASETPGS